MILKRKQPSTANKKRFRTDMLIDEQLAFLKEIEAELKLRKLEHIIVNVIDPNDLFESLFKNKQIDAVPTYENYLHNFDVYEEEMSFDLKQLSSQGVIQIYNTNLIRYHVIKKFNKELEYGRELLDIAMRNQYNLEKIRSRVEWLETEIEKILLKNKNILFPMQKKILNDSSLRINKSIKELPKLVDKLDIKKNPDELRNDSKASSSMLEVEMNAWAEKFDRKSYCSSSSLFNSVKNAEGSPEQQDIDSIVILNGEDVQNRSAEEEMTFGYHNIVENYLELKNSDINEMNVYEPKYLDSDLLEKTELAKEIEKKSTRQKDIKIESNTNSNHEIDIPFYLMPHNRFTNPEFSRSLVAKDPNSYHRLEIAVTDSYLTNVNGCVPQLVLKEKFDSGDVEILELAKRMKDFSKNIYNTTTQNSQSKNSRKSIYSDVITLEEQQNKRSQNSVKNKNNLMISHKIYKPAPLLFPSTPLPQTKHNRVIEYPYCNQPSSSKSADMSGFKKLPKRIVNQYNLKDQTKLVLFRPKATSVSAKDIIVDDENPEKEALHRAPNAIHWDQVKPVSSNLFHSGIKYEKIKSILTINLKSACFNERRDAIKHLGLLNVGDNAVLFVLNNIISDESENEIHKFEAIKSLVLLGDWNLNVFKYFAENLDNANQNITQDLLEVIIKSKNIQFIDKSIEIVQNIIENLIKIVKGKNERFALNASICIGKLGVHDCEIAIQRLVNIIEKNYDWDMKSLALEAYVRHFDSESKKTLQYIIYQISRCPIWISRSSALKLLSFMGKSVIIRNNYLDKIYELLEAKLSDDPIREVRLEVGKCMRSLQLFDQVFGRMEKNLSSHDEEVRAKAVTAIEMLGVNKTKVLTMLIDMLELDNSEYVRSLVMKALFFLAPNHPKVVAAFNNLEKGSKIQQVLVRMKNLNKGYLEKSKTL